MIRRPSPYTQKTIFSGCGACFSLLGAFSQHLKSSNAYTGIPIVSKTDNRLLVYPARLALLGSNTPKTVSKDSALARNNKHNAHLTAFWGLSLPRRRFL